MSDEPQPRVSPEPGQAVRAHVTRVVERIQSGYLEERPWSTRARRQLAELRRTLGAAGAADPRSWAIVLHELPESLQGPRGEVLARPTPGERAVLTALTTYAIHQQSVDRPMHRRGIRLGEATRSAARGRARMDSPGGLDTATVDRLHRVSMAQTQELRAQSLRALVQLLRTAKVPLDYGRLAEDLYWLQDPQRATRVHLAWGRGLHRLGKDEAQPDAPPGSDPGTTRGEQP